MPPTYPILPLGKLPSNASPTDKNVLAPKERELIDAVNDLNQRLAKLEQAPAPIPPVPEPLPTPLPTPPDPIPEPPTGGVAERPRVTPRYQYPEPHRVINVSSGGDLQAALNTARGTDNIEIRVAPGEYKGHFSVASSGDGWLVVKGLTSSPGTRARPSTMASAPKLVSINTDPLLRITGRKVWWEGFDAAIGTAVSALTYNIVALEPMAADLVLRGLWVHGQARSEVQRGILLNSGAAEISDCWLSDLHAHGFEGHGIGGWSSTGPQLISNNYIEAAGINIMIGGATPTSTDSSVVPSVVAPNVRTADVTIRRNHLIKPLAWKGDWTCKNLLETKNVNRILVEDNVLENSWTSAQVGIGVVFKSANDQGDCNWCQSTDITFRRNLVKNVEQAIQINAAENYNATGNPPPPLARLLMQDCVFDDVGSVGGSAKAVQLTSGHSSVGCADVTLERTVIQQGAGKTVAAMLLVGPFVGAQRAAFRDNVWTHGVYPIINGEGAIGIPALDIGAPGAVWSGMTLVKSPNHTDGTPALPPGTTVVTSESAAPIAAQIRATVSAAVSGVVLPP